MAFDDMGYIHRRYFLLKLETGCWILDPIAGSSKFEVTHTSHFLGGITLADLPDFCYKAAFYEIDLKMSISKLQT
jgi:hypothetical protein